MSQATKIPWTQPDLDVPDPKEPVRSRYAPGEITERCDAAFVSANATLDAIAATPVPERTVDATLLRFEQVMGDIADATMPLAMMSYVSPDSKISAEGAACEEKTGIFMVSVYTRRDIYDAIRGVTPRTPDETRLYEKTIRQFTRNGLSLPDDRLAKVREMKANLSRSETRFSTNLNNDTSTLEFTLQELAGVPEAVLDGFKKTGNGTYSVTTKTPDYLAVMQSADSSVTRKRMQFAFVNRQSVENTRLLEEAIVLRQQIAKELGFATWADYRIDGRMAGTTGHVLSFLAALKEPLKVKAQGGDGRTPCRKEKVRPFGNCGGCMGYCVPERKTPARKICS